MTIKIYTDGACRSNGKKNRDAFLGLGVVLIDQNQETLHFSKCVPGNTNNEAEYCALIYGLEEAAKLYIKCDIEVYMDSELIVKQMMGIYRVKNDRMQLLYAKVHKLIKDNLPYKISFTHVRREFNTEADSLANKALDDLN